MIKNVLPFFLDGGIQDVDESAFWNGTSSFVKVSAPTTQVAVIFGDRDSNNNRVKHGTMVVITAVDATQTITVNPASDFNSGQGTISLTANGDSVLLMFKGPSGSNVYGEWVVLSRFQADTTNDLTDYATETYVTNQLDALADADTTYSGDLTFEGLEIVALPSSVASDGSDAATAAALTISDRVHEVSGSAHVKLNAASIGTVVTIVNTDGSNVTVHPDGVSFTAIDGAASFALAAQKAATFYFVSGNNIFTVS